MPALREKRGVGNRRKPGNARPGCWRVQIVTPFWYYHFHPDGFSFVQLVGKTFAAGPCRRGHPRPAFSQNRLDSHHGRVAFGGPDDREPAWHFDSDAKSILSNGDGTIPLVGNHCEPSTVQSDNSQPIHIWTTMDFDSKGGWLTAHTTFSSCLCSTSNSRGSPRDLVELVELFLRRVPPDHPTLPLPP